MIRFLLFHKFAFSRHFFFFLFLGQNRFFEHSIDLPINSSYTKNDVIMFTVGKDVGFFIVIFSPQALRRHPIWRTYLRQPYIFQFIGSRRDFGSKAKVTNHSLQPCYVLSLDKNVL